MLIPKLTEITYQPDAGLLFEAVSDLPFACWLDSGRPVSLYGRYDIIVAEPTFLLTSKGEKTYVAGVNSTEVYTDDPLQLLQQYLSEINLTSSENQRSQNIPFCGGALGYFSYDLSRRLHRLPSLAATDIDLPEMQVGIFHWTLLQDHLLKKAWLISLPDCRETTRQHILKRVAQSEKQRQQKTKECFNISNLRQDTEVNSYRETLHTIDQYIHAGDCYQVNFAQRFSADFNGSAYAAYRELRRALPSPFSAFLSLETGAVMSLSPERFIQVKQRQVETKPIKGTIVRGVTQEQDRINAEILQNSTKDRAENLMIVDLLRNDLSKVCALGSVRVPELFSLESYANVHHLVSTITGMLERDKTPIDLFRACFPGGSITGTPKLRAMQIIEELEPCRRSVYCGSIGYISANNNMDSNIAIRTLACVDKRIYCWGGGGIVADSDCDQEYAESLAKIQILLNCLAQASYNTIPLDYF